MSTPQQHREPLQAMVGWWWSTRLRGGTSTIPEAAKRRPHSSRKTNERSMPSKGNRTGPLFSTESGRESSRGEHKLPLLLLLQLLLLLLCTCVVVVVVAVEAWAVEAGAAARVLHSDCVHVGRGGGVAWSHELTVHQTNEVEAFPVNQPILYRDLDIARALWHGCSHPEPGQKVVDHVLRCLQSLRFELHEPHFWRATAA